MVIRLISPCLTSMDLVQYPYCAQSLARICPWEAWWIHRAVAGDIILLSHPAVGDLKVEFSCLPHEVNEQ